MFCLNIIDNDVLLILAETLAIVIGSILMGILLGYLHWGSRKKKVAEFSRRYDLEKDLTNELREQLKQQSLIKNQLESEINEVRSKYAAQARTIFDHQQHLYQYEAELKSYKETIDQLNAAIDTYQHRLEVIEQELLKFKNTAPIPAKSNSVQGGRANYDHVSKLLGRQVTENDLTLISGIGPKTSALLQSHGILTWEKLANTSIESLQQILNEAGGVYKSQDPTHWPKQAVMAARSEWRKLRVFQETIKKVE